MTKTGMCRQIAVTLRFSRFKENPVSDSLACGRINLVNFRSFPLRTLRDQFLELPITLNTNPVYCVVFIDRISYITETVVSYPKECLAADKN